MFSLAFHAGVKLRSDEKADLIHNFYIKFTSNIQFE